MKLLLENWRKHLNESVNPEEELYLGDISVEGKIIPVWLDPKDGIGQVPWNQNVNYMGFVVYMTPGEFLILNPSREFSTDNLTEFMLSQDELRIGPPFMNMKWGKETGQWKITGHEGRGRMEVLNEYMPDKEIPVHVFPRGMRGHDVTDEMLFADILADPRGDSNFILSPTKVILNGEIRTQ
jgi:hypothetical protein